MNSDAKNILKVIFKLNDIYYIKSLVQLIEFDIDILYIVEKKYNATGYYILLDNDFIELEFNNKPNPKLPFHTIKKDYDNLEDKYKLSFNQFKEDLEEFYKQELENDTNRN